MGKNNKKGKSPKFEEAKFIKYNSLVEVQTIESELNGKIEIYEDLLIAFNTKYIREAFKLIESEEITFQTPNKVSPVVITNDINKGLEMVLPVRILN